MPPTPPRRAATAGGALLTGALLVALRWRDPHVPGSWGLCPWLVMTGTPCPTCGGLRALANLLAGRPGPAFEHHPYLVASLVALVSTVIVAGGVMRRPAARVRPAGSTAAIAVVWLAGLLLFGVARALTPGWWPPVGAG